MKKRSNTTGTCIFLPGGGDISWCYLGEPTKRGRETGGKCKPKGKKEET